MTGDPLSLRTIIVDDEPMARATLKSLLGGDGEIELVKECGDGDSALAAILELKPDLVFLDVEMPGLGGMEIMKRLPDTERPTVIFTTAYEHYAAEAFDVRALDYLLKPFDDSRFQVALDRAKQRIRRDQVLAAGKQLAGLVEQATPHEVTDSTETEQPPTRLIIKREGGLELVETDSIRWIEAADQYVKLHIDQGEILMRESLSALEQKLDKDRFLRVHRSAMVALDQITRLSTSSGGVGKIQLKDGTWVPVSRSRLATLRKQLD